jgi:hypothetical protein
MADINAALTAHRTACDELFKAAERTGSAWSTPRAPGKWSPAQIIEHVARSLDESAHAVAGKPSNFTSFPAPLRPIVRGLLFRRVLHKRVFPKAKTFKAFDPENGSATPAEARRRLDEAIARFEQACKARVSAGQVMNSTVFGRVAVEDYAVFQEIHAVHHRKQIPA